MTNERQAPREWKIWCQDIRHQAVCGIDTDLDGTVVIEKSAYEAMTEERDNAKDLKLIAERAIQRQAQELSSALDNVDSLAKERDELKAELNKLELNHLHDPWLGPAIGKTWEMIVAQLTKDRDAWKLMAEKFAPFVSDSLYLMNDLDEEDIDAANWVLAEFAEMVKEQK